MRIDIQQSSITGKLYCVGAINENTRHSLRLAIIAAVPQRLLSFIRETAAM
jgi:hypothetical protein